MWIHRTGHTGDDELEAILYPNALGNCEQNSRINKRETVFRHCVAKQLEGVPSGCSAARCDASCSCHGQGNSPHCDAVAPSCCSQAICVARTVPCPP